VTDCGPDNDIQAMTRRVVGRAALRRASRLVGDWQHEEREKARLVRLAVPIQLFVALLGLAFFIFN